MPTHIVVCESDVAIAQMISCRLMRADFEVHTAHDTQSAWNLVDRVRPQLLITDLQFPGIDLICRVRGESQTADLPVIALSEVDNLSRVTDDLRRELKLSIILPKPFSLRRLVRLAFDATETVLA